MADGPQGELGGERPLPGQLHAPLVVAMNVDLYQPNNSRVIF